MRLRPTPLTRSRRVRKPEGVSLRRDFLTRAELPALVDGYLLDLDIRQCSVTTLSSRRERIGRLTWFLDERGIERLDGDTLKAFFAYLNSAHRDKAGRWGNQNLKKPIGPGRVKAFHATFKALLNYCIREERLTVNPMAKIPAPQDKPDQIVPFTIAQIDLMLKAARLSKSPKRNEAIFLTLLDTGIRASELCALTVGDVDLTACRVTIRQGKGGKLRQVPFSQETRRALYGYLREYQAAKSEPMFPSERGERAGEALSGHTLMRLVKRLAKSVEATGAKYSPHTFRHTFAINFLRNGGNPLALMAMLGHEDMTMTRRYTLLAQADVERQHREFSPVANLKNWRGKG